MKLKAKALGAAFGIIWGLAIFIMTLVSMSNGYGDVVLSLLRNIYPGYEVSGMGSVIGLVYGFIDGFIGGWLVAYVYNKIA